MSPHRRRRAAAPAGVLDVLNRALELELSERPWESGLQTSRHFVHRGRIPLSPGNAPTVEAGPSGEAECDRGRPQNLCTVAPRTSPTKPTIGPDNRPRLQSTHLGTPRSPQTPHTLPHTPGTHPRPAAGASYQINTAVTVSPPPTPAPPVHLTVSTAWVRQITSRLRETLEAGIISELQYPLPELTAVAVLLGFVDQIIPYSPSQNSGSRTELLNEGQGERRYSTFGRSAPNINPQLLSPVVRARDLDDDAISDVSSIDGEERPTYDRNQVVRALKTQVWSGALIGLAAASVVGAIVLYIVSLARDG
ncbi:iron ion transporter [Trichosporon asahii var. asahii CBS 8904]|uniref:Iron ion transporter n=1 Tax=Trichosporon asahii var. asahii (strain CBS 8904) TaxID=1220162 RepID=K1W4N8_TRIAC|nr:iron ion transporter [Trichosporon asahii var. asahii CBS 8904]